MRNPTTPTVPAVLGLFFCLVSVAPAGAAGINLFWNDCGLGATATTNRELLLQYQ